MKVTKSNSSALPAPAVAIAVALTAGTLGVGYWALGLATMLIFTAGFVGGLLLWLVRPDGGTWADIRAPYWMALTLFVIHRVEEKQMEFFAFLAEVTGCPLPR